jgi:Bacterial Ig domain
VKRLLLRLLLHSHSLTSPKAGSSVPHGSILVNGTAADNAGGSSVKTVQVQVDYGVFATATPASPGNWSIWSITERHTFRLYFIE